MHLLPSSILLFSLFLPILHCGCTAETDANLATKSRLRIGVPSRPFSKKFVSKSPNGTYNGFCIQVLEEVFEILKYDVVLEYVEFHGSYNELVESVANKTFDAAMGDITITSKRYTLVDFTEPFTESGLTTVVPLVKRPRGWFFLRPFTAGLWAATGGILVYTMLVVWFIEHRSNPEFSGSWRDQLGNAMWFTLSSLFFAHRERINRSHTRMVVVGWLFVVMILILSYGASFTSMLTVARLVPNIESLETDNAKVGCEESSFMKDFVRLQLGYKTENMRFLTNHEDYLKAFRNKSITAAFLEIPNAKILVGTHCREFTVTGSSYRFGGLAFAFQKGSSYASNVSKVILELSENGTLKKFEELWLSSSSECSDSNVVDNYDRLTIENFWELYLSSVIFSLMCLLLFIFRLLKDYRTHEPSQGANVQENIWTKIVGILKYLKNAEPRDGKLAPSSSEVVPKI